MNTNSQNQVFLKSGCSITVSLLIVLLMSCSFSVVIVVCCCSITAFRLSVRHSISECPVLSLFIVMLPLSTRRRITGLNPAFNESQNEDILIVSWISTGASVTVSIRRIVIVSDLTVVVVSIVVVTEVVNCGQHPKSEINNTSTMRYFMWNSL